MYSQAMVSITNWKNFAKLEAATPVINLHQREV